MRMRKKPNLIPRMARCSKVLVEAPEAMRGKWLTGTGYRQVFLEIGCGKGRFTAQTAAAYPDALYIAIERVPDAMVVAMERACADSIENVRFIDMDARKLSDIFCPGEVDRIYLNFSDPWPSRRHEKRRLTHPDFLRLYAAVLAQDGEIHFKTDNNGLFDFSLKSFAAEGWQVSEVTRDLHRNGICGIMTDYEEKFHNQGIPINRCVARRPDNSASKLAASDYREENSMLDKEGNL